MKILKWILITFVVLIVAVFGKAFLSGFNESFAPGKMIEKAKNKAQGVPQSYYNPIKGIKFTYASTWEQDPQITDGPNPIIGKFDGAKDTSFVLLHQENTKKLTLEKYSASAKKDLAFVPEFSLVSEGETTVNGVKAYQITANYKDGFRNKNVMFLNPAGTTIFTLVYRSKQETFDSSAKDFDGVLNTVEMQ